MKADTHLACPVIKPERTPSMQPERTGPLSPGTGRRVVILVENLPVPLDRRVWLEATTLTRAGYHVSVISPMGRGWTAPYEVIEGVHIFRFPEPPEAHSGAVAYGREWGHALWHMIRLSFRVRREQGFDVLHGCNPPDLIWLVALIWRVRGVRYVFDHHDVCPELFEAKFDRRGGLYAVMRLWERLTFATASVSLATNESFRRIAVTRGGMNAKDVFVVRSAPKVEQFLPGPGDMSVRKGAATAIGYVGVIGQQEGMDLLVAAADHLIRVLAQVDPRLADVQFVIAGFGPHLPHVVADVAKRGLTSHFTFTGALYGPDLLAMLNAVDIGVSPDPKNLMNDISTMNKVMEYMTLEKPVVQFDLTEGRASAGGASLYARPNDPVGFAVKLAALIVDPALRAQMGRMGRARVLGSLSWEHSAPHLLAAYDRVFAKAGHVSRHSVKATPGAALSRRLRG